MDRVFMIICRTKETTNTVRQLIGDTSDRRWTTLRREGVLFFNYDNPRAAIETLTFWQTSPHQEGDFEVLESVINAEPQEPTRTIKTEPQDDFDTEESVQQDPTTSHDPMSNVVEQVEIKPSVQDMFINRQSSSSTSPEETLPSLVVEQREELQITEKPRRKRSSQTLKTEARKSDAKNETNAHPRTKYVIECDRNKKTSPIIRIQNDEKEQKATKKNNKKNSVVKVRNDEEDNAESKENSSSESINEGPTYRTRSSINRKAQKRFRYSPSSSPE